MATATTATATDQVKATDQIKKVSSETATGINSAYDASLNAQKQALLDAYNTNTAAQTQQGQQVQEQAAWMNKDLGVQAARNTNNINQFADVRGLNRQTGSQAALSLGNARNAASNILAVQQNAALAESKRQLDQLKVKYQADVAAAIADNDYKRAAALLDDYNNQNTWREKQAEILASYGNFDPYGELYGTDAATGMKNVWLAQNPDVAYRTGQISAETYKNITGHYPTGYNAGGGGGYGGGWYYGGGGGDDKQTASLFGVNNASAKGGSGKSSGPSGHSSTSHSSASRGGTTVNSSGYSGGKGKF